MAHFTSVVLERIQAQAYLNNNPPSSIKVQKSNGPVSNMVTLAGDSRVHVAVSAFARNPGCDHDYRRSALDAQHSTFADRHLFIQSFYLQGRPGLDPA